MRIEDPKDISFPVFLFAFWITLFIDAKAFMKMLHGTFKKYTWIFILLIAILVMAAFLPYWGMVLAVAGVIITIEYLAYDYFKEMRDKYRKEGKQ